MAERKTKNQMFVDELIRVLQNLNNKIDESIKQSKRQEAKTLQKMKSVDPMSLLKGENKVFKSSQEKQSYDKDIRSQEKKLYGQQEELNDATIDNLKSQLKNTEDITENITKVSKGMGLFSRLSKMFSGTKKLDEQISGAEKAKEIEKSELINQKLFNFHASNIGLLTKIEEHLRPKQEMIEGGELKLPGFLKKFLPTGLKGIGKSFMKLAGGALILGGVAWMLSDFIEGFKEEGIKGGLKRALLGKLDGTMKSAFKNAGKFALIGGGIGLMVGGPLGGIAGALIGGAFGLLANVIGSLFVSKGDLGSKLHDFFIGGNGGVMASVFQGSKYAAMGALIGTGFAPGIGTIVGGVAGFAIGFLINWVKQMLPDNIQAGISQVFSKIDKGLTSAWNWLKEKVTGIFNGSSNFINKAFSGLKSLLGYIGEGFNWIVNKLNIKEYWNKTKEVISNAWDTLKTSISGIIDWISNLGKMLLDKFTNITKGLWSKVTNWFGNGSSKTENKPEIISKSEVINQRNQEIMNEKQTKIIEKTGMVENLLNQMLVHIKSMDMFFKESFTKNMKNTLFETFDIFYKNIRIMNEENRQWDYLRETGSLQGYENRYANFSEELNKLMSNPAKKESLNNSISNVINDNKSNINTTINTSTDAYKLRS